MVYVCDRTSNRIQVFQKDGKFVKEGIVSKNTMGATVSGQFGVVSSLGIGMGHRVLERSAAALSSSSPTATTRKSIVLQRDTMAEVGGFGAGGRQPGQFLAVGSIAVDSRGNVYTGEQHHGKRVQKWSPAAAR